MLSARIQFYDRIARMLSAGLTLPKALALPQPGRLNARIRRMLRTVSGGASLSEAMREAGGFSLIERSLVSVGEQTGTLPAQAQTLCDLLEQKLRLRRKLVTALMYPAFTYAAAGPLLKIIDLAVSSLGSGPPDFKSWIAPLTVRCLLWWGIPVLLAAAWRLFGRTLLSGRIAGMILSAVPVWGAFQHDINSALFWRMLNACLSAGLKGSTSVRLASDGCPSRFFAGRMERLATLLEAGEDTWLSAFSQIAVAREHRDGTVSMIASAEISGTLDQTAMQLSSIHTQLADVCLARLVKVFPVAVFTVLALILAFRIVTAYSELFSRVTGGLL